MRGILVAGENANDNYLRESPGGDFYIDVPALDKDVEKHFPHHLTNTPLNEISTEDLKHICGIYL
jgi:cytochrome b involved in lipid metabolism